ncbi:MAG: TonB-dependent receptor plug domain-containing protein, partial [Solimonas sp.]
MLPACLALLLAPWLVLTAPPARADLSAEIDFHIGPQPLATALTAFADATHIQVVTAAADLGALRSPGVMRRTTAAQALADLLQGTPLSFQRVGLDTVVIVAAADPPATEAAIADIGQLDDVLIIGRGYTRASSTVTPQDAPARAPGAPVQSYLEDLPGINVQNSDPYGLYEFGNSVRIRGFSNDQIGISLDGVPLESYDVRDGSPPGRFVDAEDLSSVTVAQGSGDVMMPSYHALGGSVRYFTGEPSGSWGATLSSVAGDNQLSRIYARLDTPAWWSGGPIAAASVSRTRAVQFDNHSATMDVDHAMLKLREDFDGGSAVLTYRYGDRDDHDMQNYDARGRVASWFDLLETPTGDPERDALYYRYWTNGRTDQLLSLQLRAEPWTGWKFELLPYYERKRGYGYAGVAPSAAEAQYAAAIADDGGVPGRTDIEPYDGTGIAERRESLRGERRGATLGLSTEWGRHAISAGGWYERYGFAQDRPLYNVDDDDRIETGALPIVSYYDRHFDTQVAQYYLKDSSRWLAQRLRIDIGLKGLYV